MPANVYKNIYFTSFDHLAVLLGGRQDPTKIHLLDSITEKWRLSDIEIPNRGTYAAGCTGRLEDGKQMIYFMIGTPNRNLHVLEFQGYQEQRIRLLAKYDRKSAYFDYFRLVRGNIMFTQQGYENHLGFMCLNLFSIVFCSEHF